MSDIEIKAKVLLGDTAARQAVVDRLLGRSIWNGFVTTMLVPVIANLLFLIAWSGWYQDRPEYSAIFLGGALTSLVWVSLAVMQVAGRLRALSAVLERSGILAQFVGADASFLRSDPTAASTARSNTPQQPMSGRTTEVR